MAAIPAIPALGFSFTSFSTNNPTAQQPGTNIDAEFNKCYAAIGSIIGVLKISLSADGSLSPTAVAQAGGASASTGDTTNLADAPSALSALLAQDWAEYMPDQLPSATLAQTGITGQHYSSRWWANQAAQTVATIGPLINSFQNILTTAENNLALALTADEVAQAAAQAAAITAQQNASATATALSYALEDVNAAANSAAVSAINAQAAATSAQTAQQAQTTAVALLEQAISMFNAVQQALTKLGVPVPEVGAVFTLGQSELGGTDGLGGSNANTAGGFTLGASRLDISKLK